ncbi:hypothetical protein Q3G72_004810 [Acer saccharum]|nr:hypothetical protein Q3G72_004810 [Acer saccharum]
MEFEKEVETGLPNCCIESELGGTEVRFRSRHPNNLLKRGGTVSTAPKRGQISKTSIGGSRPVTIRECHTTTATSSAGNIASEQVTILLESSSGRRVKQIASKPKSLAVTVPRDSGDEEINRKQQSKALVPPIGMPFSHRPD